MACVILPGAIWLQLVALLQRGSSTVWSFVLVSALGALASWILPSPRMCASTSPFDQHHSFSGATGKWNPSQKCLQIHYLSFLVEQFFNLFVVRGFFLYKTRQGCSFDLIFQSLSAAIRCRVSIINTHPTSQKPNGFQPFKTGDVLKGWKHRLFDIPFTWSTWISWLWRGV